MKLIETVVTETAVRIRIADDADRLKAQSWIDCQLLRSGLKRQSGTPAADLDGWHLPTVRRVILENVRAAIDAEIGRLTTP
jgi:hypothetical protein